MRWNAGSVVYEKEKKDEHAPRAERGRAGRAAPGAAAPRILLLLLLPGSAYHATCAGRGLRRCFFWGGGPSAQVSRILSPSAPSCAQEVARLPPAGGAV